MPMIRNVKYKGTNIFIIWIVLFLLQNVVAQYVPIFDYIDEVYAISGIVLLFYRVFRGRIGIKIKRNVFLILFLVYSFVCFLGNIIYKYQPLNIVLVDFFTNFKFFGAIITSLVLFRNLNYDLDKRKVLKITRVCSVILFVLLLIDIPLQIFHSDGYRYGFRAEQLIYVLPTYLAGAEAFILGLLLMFFDKKNYKYMIMALVVLASTLRSKAMAGALIFLVILYVVEIRKKRFKTWHIVAIALIGLSVAWSQIQFYYVELSGASARSLLTLTSVKIAKDYFPIGTGFGTFASHSAAVIYSPVYFKYGLNNFWELSNANPRGYFDDTFWPIIIGQSGVIGSIVYVWLLAKIFITNIMVRNLNKHMYATVLFIFGYLIISSTSEPSFNNAIAIPLAMLLGYSWAYSKRYERLNLQSTLRLKRE